MPAVWIHRTAGEIATGLAEMLLSALRLDVVYVRFKDEWEGDAIEVVRAKGGPHSVGQLQEIGQAFASFLNSNGSDLPRSINNPMGNGVIQVTRLPIGTEGAYGFLVAAAKQSDFPNEIDRLLLRVAGNQAAVMLEQKRVEEALCKTRDELEGGVQERTKELLTTNATLEAQIIERRQAEEQVRVLNVELEQRVTERTTQLESVNDSLKKEMAERQKATQMLQVLLQRTHELYSISQVVGTLRTLEDVLPVLLSSSYLKGAKRGTIAIFDQPWSKVSDPPASCDIVAEWNKDPSAPRFIGQRFTLEEYGIVPPYAYGQAIVIPSIRSHPNLPERTRQRFNALGTRSLVILPLIAGDQCYGMFSWHFRSARATIFEDYEHVRGLVDEAAIVINNMLLLEAEAKARHEAEHANALKLKFLAMISHELRTPLTAIKGFATTLLAEDVEWGPESERDFLVTINQEANKLTELIEQLMDLSRIEAGILRIVPQEQKFDAIISATMAELQAVTVQHKLVLDVTPDLPAVRVDSARIAQVLTNLVNNAVKFSPPQTSITISARRSDNMIQVDIADQGPGIPVSDHRSIFEAFRQLEDKAIYQANGLGLGLAICKGLIEAHGGQVWIQDREGPGAVFSFTLPIKDNAED